MHPGGVPALLVGEEYDDIRKMISGHSGRLTNHDRQPELKSTRYL
jgi:hypothetical protein